MARKQSVAGLAEQKFNELDNWLGIMDMDPPKSPEEKQVMYGRLMEILEAMFGNSRKPKLAPSLALDSLDKKSYYEDLKKLIPR